MSISRPQQEDQPHTVPPPRPSGRNISIGGLPSPPSSRDHSIKESPTLSYSSLLAESGDKDPWKTEIQGYSIPKHRHKPQRSFPTAWSIMSDKGLEGLKDRWKNDQEEDETEDHMADSSIQMNIFDPNPRGDSHPYASIASIASIANQQSQLSHDSPRFWEAKSSGSSLRDSKKSLDKRPLPTKVWADLMDTSKGRDKVLKCVQYSLRTYLYVLSLVSAVRPLSPWFSANQRRLKNTVSGLSLTRKCLLLLNPLHPITDLLSPEPMSAGQMLTLLIDLFSALSDDIFCLSRLGVVSKKTGKKADTWANRFWLLTTIMGLYKLHVKTIPSIKKNAQPNTFPDISPSTPTRQKRVEGNDKKLKLKDGSQVSKWAKELSDAKWTNRKLLADLVFVSYDITGFQWFSEPIQIASGLTAAFIATSKLYYKHSRASMGK